MPPILVVDDHVDTCRVMARLIRALGFTAECVYSGEDALAFVETTVPAAVILDLSMPGMDGFETLERLKQIPRCVRVPVIICSAMTDEPSRIRAKGLGADDYCLKAGFDLKEFDRLLTRYVPQSS